MTRWDLEEKGLDQTFQTNERVLAPREKEILDVLATGDTRITRLTTDDKDLRG